VRRSQRSGVLPGKAADLPLAAVADVVQALALTVNQAQKGTPDARVLGSGERSLKIRQTMGPVKRSACLIGR
jgi:hypothetical protein